MTGCQGQRKKRRSGVEHRYRCVRYGVGKVAEIIVNQRKTRRQAETRGDERLNIRVQTIELGRGAVVIADLPQHKMAYLDVFIVVVESGCIESDSIVQKTRLQPQLISC